ncbi:MAG: hypothetical protein KIT34_09655 [Cyanobacteria bacterium TGS_CYA1]|nr:hypothetical protein [Cyanobacteria bacterium TGS_CYA1]
MAFRQQPYIVFALIGLFIGMVGYTIAYVYNACEEHKQAVIIEVSQASTAITDQFLDVVFGSNYTKQDVWLSNVHSMMTKKAQAKFDQIFLPAGGEIFQNNKICLVPVNVLVVPNIDNPVLQVIRVEGRGTRVSRRMTILEPSKNNMPIKEFTLDLKLRKKHGKILIADLNVSNSPDGTSFEQFLRDAYVVENPEQFNNNFTAANFYAPRHCKATGITPRHGGFLIALYNNPRFVLARLELVKYHIFNNQLASAENELAFAKQCSTGSESAKLIELYEASIKYVRDGKLKASQMPLYATMGSDSK